MVAHKATSRAAQAAPFSEFRVLGVGDSLPIADGGLTVQTIRSGVVEFVTVGPHGNAWLVRVEDGGTVPLWPSSGWSVELLGCRPATDSRGAWAVVRLVPPV